jgi:hypothetical protein
LGQIIVFAYFTALTTSVARCKSRPSSSSPKLQTILEAARKRFRAGAGIPHEAFSKEVETEHAGRTKKRSGKSKSDRTDETSH